MNKKNKWTLDEVIYMIQFILFYITAVGGVVLIILTAIKKISLPLLGVILGYAVLVIIQVAFLVIFTDMMPDEPPYTQFNEEKTIDEEIEKEIRELKNLKSLRQSDHPQ